MTETHDRPLDDQICTAIRDAVAARFDEQVSFLADFVRIPSLGSA